MKPAKIVRTDDPNIWLEKEWLTANGLGGYSSNSLACIPTRKYHGLLVASLPLLGRTVMLNHLHEVLILQNGLEIPLNSSERPEGILAPDCLNYLEEFYLELGLPVWKFRYKDIVLEKRIVMTHQQNSTHVLFRLQEASGPVKLKLYPYVCFRPTGQVHAAHESYKFTLEEGHYEIIGQNYPPLRLFLYGNENFTIEEHRIKDVYYPLEARHGYPSLSHFWSPGFFLLDLEKNRNVSLLASCESWEAISALKSQDAYEAERERREILLKKSPESSRIGFGEDLILAADQFIIKPSSRIQDRVRAAAVGNDIRTVIAGYHWFNDWGRDTMISLEGLTLCTGRYEEARWILRTFAYYVKNGLIPNMFPEGQKTGLYHTADASLWFFHALNRYLKATQDYETLQFVFPQLLEIYDSHIKGTQFGIHVDNKDSLLVEGAEGYQLTWMDAKVDDWVVTPRRGKAVEINALWFNALKLLGEWVKGRKDSLSDEIARHTTRAYESFNQKFWNDEKGYLFDVVEGENGNDDALRPNQLFAISLDFPILAEKRWAAVFEKCRQMLFTPLGLRSLSPDHPDYKARYDGDLRARDSAYHQGTIWSWLIGPYIDTWLKIYPEDTEKVREVLNGFESHLSDAGIGYISEIFDATPPYTARGCIAQAWSIAELLRCYKVTST